MFIVPCPCAGTGSTWPKAASTTSTIRLDVSMFPAPTAAGDRALTTQPSGSHSERRERTGRRRDVRVGDDAEHERARGLGHGERAVEIAVVLG